MMFVNHVTTDCDSHDVRAFVAWSTCCNYYIVNDIVKQTMTAAIAFLEDPIPCVGEHFDKNVEMCSFDPKLSIEYASHISQDVFEIYVHISC